MIELLPSKGVYITAVQLVDKGMQLGVESALGTSILYKLDFHCGAGTLESWIVLSMSLSVCPLLVIVMCSYNDNINTYWTELDIINVTNSNDTGSCQYNLHVRRLTRHQFGIAGTVTVESRLCMSEWLTKLVEIADTVMKAFRVGETQLINALINSGQAAAMNETQQLCDAIRNMFARRSALRPRSKPDRQACNLQSSILFLYGKRDLPVFLKSPGPVHYIYYI